MNPNSPNPYAFPAKYTPEGIKEKRMITQNATCIFAGILTWLLLRSLLPNIMYSGLGIFFTLIKFAPTPERTAIVRSVVDIIGTVLSLGVPFLVVMRIIDIPAKIALPFRKIRSGFNIGSLFIALGASTVAVYIGSFLASAFQSVGFSPSVPEFNMPTDVTTAILYFVSIVLVPAFLEEMVFRGIVLQPLRRFGDSFAIVISAIIFSLAHLNIYQIPNAFVMGLILGYFVVRSGSLWAGIIIHFANNFFVALLEYIGTFVTNDAMYIMTVSLYVFYLAAGLISLIITSRKQKKLFMLYPAECVLTSKERYQCYFKCFSTIELLIVLAILSLYHML